jgi:hypothetical protein
MLVYIRGLVGQRSFVLDDKRYEVLTKLRGSGLALTLSGAALLISALRTQHLTLYHALIVLNLSWINILAALVPFEALQSIFDPQFDGPGLKKIAKASSIRLFVVGLLQVELTAYLGVKVFAWNRVFSSDLPTNCAESTKFHVIWITTLASNSTFRSIFTKVYIIGLVPSLSALALYGIISMHGVILLWIPRPYGRLAMCIFGPLLWICIIIASTEATIRINTVSPGENVWSFGQTFALLILVFPITDILSEVKAWVWDGDETDGGEQSRMREIPANVLVPSLPVRSLLRL